MIYVFFGADEYLRDRQVAAMKAKLGDPTTASMNLTVLDGDRFTLAELQENCGAMPFLAEKRLVIVRHFLDRFEKRRSADGPAEPPVAVKRDKDLADQVKAYLPDVPPTTHLVFVEDAFSEANPLWTPIHAADKFVKPYYAPAGSELTAWIARQVGEAGGEIAPAAAQLLAAYVGSDTRHLVTEIEKLVTYTSGKRPIKEADVEALVAEVKEATIFQLVDTVASHNGKRGIDLLHTLIDKGESPIYILAMITRQFRMLLQVKEMMGAGATQGEMQSKLQMHPFVVGKVGGQARNFTLERLEAIYRRLVEVDAGIKRGRLEPVVALDMLVVELAGIV